MRGMTAGKTRAADAPSVVNTVGVRGCRGERRHVSDSGRGRSSSIFIDRGLGPPIVARGLRGTSWFGGARLLPPDVDVEGFRAASPYEVRHQGLAEGSVATPACDDGMGRGRTNPFHTRVDEAIAGQDAMGGERDATSAGQCIAKYVVAKIRNSTRARGNRRWAGIARIQHLTLENVAAE